jgi:uncharacterized membrane protein YbaN (DUF454 family)
MRIPCRTGRDVPGGASRLFRFAGPSRPCYCDAVARPLYLIAGFLCLGLAVIGALLPVMPTTVFVILAAWCFARSSPALERRLLEHPRFGPHILRWRTSGAISRQAKRAATVALALSIAAELLFVPLPWSLLAAAVVVAVGVWIWTRPEKT